MVQRFCVTGRRPLAPRYKCGAAVKPAKTRRKSTTTKTRGLGDLPYSRPMQSASPWPRADGSSAQRVLFLRVKMFKRFWPVGSNYRSVLAALARAVVHFKGSQTQFGAPAAVP